MKYILYWVDCMTLFLAFRAVQCGKWVYAIVFAILNFCVFRKVVDIDMGE